MQECAPTMNAVESNRTYATVQAKITIKIAHTIPARAGSGKLACVDAYVI